MPAQLRAFPLIACLLLLSAAALAQPRSGIAAGGLEIRAAHFSRAVALAGRRVELTVEVINQGDRPAAGVTIDTITPPDVSLDIPEGGDGSLGPGMVVRRVWTLTADRPGIYPVEVRVRAEGQPERSTSVMLVVTQLPRGLSTRGDRHPHVKADVGGSYVFRNEGMVAVLLHSEAGYGPLLVYPASRPTQPPSDPIGVVPVLARVTWREGDAERTGAFVPKEAKVAGDDTLRLRGTVGEGAGSWETEVELSIDDAPWLSWRGELRPSAAGKLVRFTPLPLAAGEVGPREALFPGIELLGGEETAPVRTPDPYDVTIPLMAVAQARTTVGHLWNAKQTWGGAGYPGALFDPRNDLGGDRMEVFVPAAAGGTDVAAASRLRLEGKLLVLREEPSPIAAVRQWVKAFGQPIMAGFPRSLEATRKLCRDALTKTLWNPEFKGWSPAIGENPLPPIQDSYNVSLLLMEAGRSTGETRTALLAQAQSVLADLRKEGPVDPVLAYRTGGVFSSLAAERAALQTIVDDQLASGAWTWESLFPPSSQDQGSPIGEPGETELGIVTARALSLLRYAAWTGDSNVAGAGLKALELIDERFRLPRGAQLFGFPLHANSLLAATEAAECNLLGYQVSGELRWLDRARYWADAGLPFVYLWGDETHPAMMHAAKAGIGSGPLQETSYANVMQWTGLAYARVLRMLSRVRPDGLYDYVSEGILASAMRQQHESGELAGLLPEMWNPRENKGAGLNLSPQLVLSALYPLSDLTPQVSHARVRVGPDRMFIASGASIFKVATSAMRARINLKWVDGEAFTTVIGVPARPISVQYNTSALRRFGIPVSRTFLEEVASESEPGWNYDEETGTLILRLRHTGGEDHLEIRWPDPKDRSPVNKIDTRPRPKR
jgi:hypothetical protein